MYLLKHIFILKSISAVYGDPIYVIFMTEYYNNTIKKMALEE